VPDSNLPVNAVIINGTLENAKSIQDLDAFKQADIRLFISEDHPPKEIHEWAIEQQVEVIDINEEPERIREALESSIWPGASLKSDSSNHFLQPLTLASSPNLNSPPVDRAAPLNGSSLPLQFEDNFSDQFDDFLEDDRDQMAALFNMVGQARSAQNLSDQERRRNAERVMCAISKMLGEDLDLDS